MRKLEQIAELLSRRNAIDEQISAIIQRPMTSGHLGEWIASQIFDIKLEESATTTAFDGRFRSGPLQGRTVNVKWYLKQEGVLDTSASTTLDYYLVLTGPRSAAGSSRDDTRPWCVRAAYLFDARRLHVEQNSRGVKTGVASSVLRRQWDEAEIYPHERNSLFQVSPHEAELLELLTG
ncbi:hypothetical protein [Actinomadura rubrisoli]|uniref:Uncharacterized protein n=1 Tax=Actinomadura rubrisoli TaxID=2530368 RepID=A0A4R5C3B8_9ACTN|nr:hypothetical protein [Actinomadura rubrisoli]TDD94148.1 hypothetical protein E1298_07495 [Actinomadura rubrisoli]